MKVLILTLAILASPLAHAGSFYIVNGKFVKAGEASKAKSANPQAHVIKIQAATQAYNNDTGRLKKESDVSIEDLKKALSTAK